VCLIVDANLASVVFASPPQPDFVPVLDWLMRKDGCVVYGGRLAAELARLQTASRYLRALRQAGKARLVPGHVVTTEQEAVVGTGLCRSNDPHVIALARVSGARTLCTRDKALHRDFKNLSLISHPKGKVYQSREHEGLLGHTSSCGRLPKRRRR
jgi:hypothetical protein